MNNFDLKKYLTEGKFTKTYLKEDKDTTGIASKFNKYNPLVDLDSRNKQVTFQTQGNLKDEDFKAAKQHLIDLGYEVNQDQSHNDFMKDDDRDIYPRIIFRDKEYLKEGKLLKENSGGVELGDSMRVNPDAYPNLKFPYGTVGTVNSIDNDDWAVEDLVYTVKLKHIGPMGDEEELIYVEDLTQYIEDVKEDYSSNNNDTKLRFLKNEKADFDTVIHALQREGIPGHLILHKDGNIDLLLGRGYPDSLADKARGIAKELKIHIGVMAQGSFKEKLVDSYMVNGGPQEWDKDGYQSRDEDEDEEWDDNIYTEGESVKNEMDMNDPIMVKMRATKDKKADFGKDYGDAVKKAYSSNNNDTKLRFLKKERAQLLRDMEEEAEPEGGPIADEYGSKLDNINAAIDKLSGQKGLTYSQAIAKNDALSEESNMGLADIKEMGYEAGEKAFEQVKGRFINKPDHKAYREGFFQGFTDNTNSYGLNEDLSGVEAGKTFANMNREERKQYGNYVDHADIGQFATPEKEWNDHDNDYFYKLGLRIVKQRYKGNVEAAYDYFLNNQKVDESYNTANEDLDLGHEDNEPGMLKGDLYKIGTDAMELYQMMDSLEGQGEVDFPHWWQSKIVTAKNMISGAKHYLDFEMKEPAIDATIDAADVEESIDREFHSTSNTNGHPNWKDLSADEIKKYIAAPSIPLWGRDLRIAKMVLAQKEDAAVTEDTSFFTKDVKDAVVSKLMDQLRK